MHDPDAAADRKSRRLLGQIEDLKALDARLHRTARGSPEFDALEHEIESTARLVFDRTPLSAPVPRAHQPDAAAGIVITDAPVARRPARASQMQGGSEQPMRMTDLKSGWAVVGNDGHRLGTIREVGQQYVLASRAGPLGGDLYVPASAIANVEGSVVYLNLARREAEQMGWEQPPRLEDHPETTPENDLHRHV